MTRPLLALSNVIIDRIRDPDGSERPPVAGGAGLYAAAAMTAWWPNVALVAGVGRDFGALTGPAVAAHGFDRRGLVVRDDHCIQSLLVYAADGSRTETPTLGQDHFRRMQITPADIDPALRPAAGSYIFRDGDAAFWDACRGLRDQLGMMLWEVDAGFAAAGDQARFGEIAGMVDIVSLNLQEAGDLIGERRPAAALDRLLALGIPVVILRMGAEGALVADRHDRFQVHPPLHPVVDVTGGGNAFSGGFLAGLCRTPADLRAAARAAAASAACAIAGHGPPPPPAADLAAALASATGIETLQHPIG